MFERYAIFYTPPPGDFADFGAAWLGWDSARGCAVAHPEIACMDVAEITATPRKYGLHGTLKAPFRLARDASLSRLREAVETFAARHMRVILDGLEMRYKSGFVALRGLGDLSGLADLAAHIVRDFDVFRAPLNAAEISRRRRAMLSVRQDKQMRDWGYPFVFDDFRFHITLSGRMSAPLSDIVMHGLAPRIDPVLPRPFVLDALTLMGQDSAGLFHQIDRIALRA